MDINKDRYSTISNKIN